MALPNNKNQLDNANLLDLQIISIKINRLYLNRNKTLACYLQDFDNNF